MFTDHSSKNSIFAITISLSVSAADVNATTDIDCNRMDEVVNVVPMDVSWQMADANTIVTINRMAVSNVDVGWDFGLMTITNHALVNGDIS